MDLASAIILGIIQGLTEWLPISSSGHLVIAQELFGITAPASFDIAVMLGTVVALIIYFRYRIYKLSIGILKQDSESIWHAKLILIAGIPTAIIGFAGRTFFTGLFNQPIAVACLLVATGAYLFLASSNQEGRKKIGHKEALFIGIAQGLSVAPGISRSGSTICTAMIMGVEKKEAAEFSFLIGIPAMLVASSIESFELLQSPSLLHMADGIGIHALLAGVLAAFFAGYASIGLFMKMLKEHKLIWFAYYCVILGLIAIILLLL